MALLKSDTQKSILSECEKALTERKVIQNSIQIEESRLEELGRKLAVKRQELRDGETPANREKYAKLRDEFDSVELAVSQLKRKKDAADRELQELEPKVRSEWNSIVAQMRAELESEYLAAARNLTEKTKRLCAMYQHLGIPPVMIISFGMSKLNIPDLGTAMNIASDVSVYDRTLDAIGQERLNKCNGVRDVLTLIDAELKAVKEQTKEEQRKKALLSQQADAADPYRNAIRLN